MYNVFISYLREDKERVQTLALALRRMSVDVFVDQSGLPIGARWREEIASAIRESDFLLACFSSAYEKRPDNGMLVELIYAISLRKEGQKYPEILPVKLNACDIPGIPLGERGKLSDLQWELLDDENWGTGVRKLGEVILQPEKERAKSRLRAKAEEVSVKNSDAVKAREEYAAHQRREIRHQVLREVFRANSPERWSHEGFKTPNVWPAQRSAQKETELEYARSEYNRAQIAFVQKFGEEYHPLPEFLDRMAKEEERIRKSFADAEKADDRDINQGMSDLVIAFVLLGALAVAVAIIFSWLKRTLGF